MKKDNLEKFISDNRSAFDSATPSLKVWANIDKAISSEQPTQQKKKWSYYKVAAAATLLIVAGSILGFFMAQNQQTSTLAFENSGEYQDMQSFYERQLQDKTVQLASYNHADETIPSDLEQLDKVMEELKLELLNAPKGSEERIINAMIQNYQAKLFVLDRILEQLNSSNHSTKNNDNGTVKL